MLMAGLDGIQNKIEPPDPVDKDLYDLPPEELAKVPQVPGSLDEALDALEGDHEFLKAGGVFTDDLIEHLDRLQAGQRGRRHPAAAPPVGVPPLLRRRTSDRLVRPVIHRGVGRGPPVPNISQVTRFTLRHATQRGV